MAGSAARPDPVQEYLSHDFEPCDVRQSESVSDSDMPSIDDSELMIQLTTVEAHAARSVSMGA